jgi:hypothetical protein
VERRASEKPAATTRTISPKLTISVIEGHLFRAKREGGLGRPLQDPACGCRYGIPRRS